MGKSIGRWEGTNCYDFTRLSEDENCELEADKKKCIRDFLRVKLCRMTPTLLLSLL